MKIQGITLGQRHSIWMRSVILLMVMVNFAVASKLGGYAGAASRFSSDPTSAGTGGITLFFKTSTNSYSQNPSALAFLGKRTFDAGMVNLSLDRYIYSVSGSSPLPPTATLAAGIIASGTQNIEGRDSRGYSAGELTDSEMTYLVSFANKFSEKLAFGLSLKVLTKHLGAEDDWLDLKGSGFGAGIGFTYKPLESTTISFALKDWNSSYKWKTQDQDLYDQGRSYRNVLPMSLAWGWMHEMKTLTFAIEHDYYFIEENIFRGALMWHGIPNLIVSAGASYEDENIFPGVSARYELAFNNGPPMHLDFGFRGGISGEGLRNYLGWGVNF